MKLMIATMATALALTPLLVADDDPAELRDEASAVFSEITAPPNKGIPRELDRPSWQRKALTACSSRNTVN